MKIEFNKVIKKFKHKIILDNLSFKINSGSSVAIIGRSGAGKTTIARILCGIDKHYSGEVLVDNISLNATNFKEIRKKISFVFQNFNLFPHFNVMENICYAPINVYKMNKKETEEEAILLLQTFGMLDNKNKYPSELSAGQKQRTAIIRSLMIKPQIIIMDEPTAALDPELTNDAIKLIEKIRKKGISVITITHDMKVARNVSDHIMFISHGECIDYCETELFFKSDYIKSQDARIFLSNFFI